MGRLGDIWRSTHGMLTHKPTNFSWVIERSLAASGIPTSHYEVEWLKKNGIKAILTVKEEPLPNEWLDGLEYMYIHALDLMAPEIEDIDKGVTFMRIMINNNKPVLVHCAAGKGRTGTMLAAYFIKYERLSVEDAINKVRNLRPGSVQSRYQELALNLYARYLDNKLRL